MKISHYNVARRFEISTFLTKNVNIKLFFTNFMIKPRLKIKLFFKENF